MASATARSERASAAVAATGAGGGGEQGMNDPDCQGFKKAPSPVTSRVGDCVTTPAWCARRVRPGTKGEDSETPREGTVGSGAWLPLRAQPSNRRPHAPRVARFRHTRQPRWPRGRGGGGEGARFLAGDGDD